MKYNGLSIIKDQYANPIFQLIKQLLRSNIKMPFFNSFKRINFSERQFNGESFLFQNKSLFPYHYNVITDSEFSQPLNIALTIENNLNELELCSRDNNYKNSFELKVKDSLETNIKTLDKIFKFNKKLDFPVSTFAIYCFSKAILDKEGIAKGVIEEETFLRALNHFFEKINYADGTYISFIMCALVKNNIWHSCKWKMIFKRLKEVKFEFEFTKVDSINPHLFQYQEIKEKTDKKDSLKYYGDAFYALNSIKEAVKSNVEGSKEALEEFSKRVIV